MASTRNKNTYGNYCLENRQLANSAQYTIYKNSACGEAVNTNLAGNGLNPGQIPWNKLSHNPADIESFLFGINSTNLVNPAPCLTPKLKTLKQINIFNTEQVLMPIPLVVPNKQRPLPMS